MQQYHGTFLAGAYAGGWHRVRDRNHAWPKDILKGAPEDAGEEYHSPHFHWFVLRGVADLPQVMAELAGRAGMW